jgi:hypothetical protein
MRTRELIGALKALHAEPVKAGVFPGRTDIRKAAAAEYDRLGRLDALVPQIIERLKSLTQEVRHD